jgi:hypothetical protein
VDCSSTRRLRHDPRTSRKRPIIQRKALSPNDFTDLDVIKQRLTRFEVRYNTAAKPFKWKFTANDLADLLERLDRHQETQTPDGAQPAAA